MPWNQKQQLRTTTKSNNRPPAPTTNRDIHLLFFRGAIIRRGRRRRFNPRRRRRWGCRQRNPVRANTNAVDGCELHHDPPLSLEAPPSSIHQKRRPVCEGKTNEKKWKPGAAAAAAGFQSTRCSKKKRDEGLHHPPAWTNSKYCRATDIHRDVMWATQRSTVKRRRMGGG